MNKGLGHLGQFCLGIQAYLKYLDTPRGIGLMSATEFVQEMFHWVIGS